MDGYCSLEVRGGGETCDFLVGIVVFLSITLVNIPPMVSTPSESGVTSNSRYRELRL